MIVFSLRCSNGHVFDEWFANGAEFDDKAAHGGLRCPECGDADVAKAIMAPRIGKAAPEPAPCGAAGCGGGACAFANEF